MKNTFLKNYSKRYITDLTGIVVIVTCQEIIIPIKSNIYFYYNTKIKEKAIDMPREKF